MITMQTTLSPPAQVCAPFYVKPTQPPQIPKFFQVVEQTAGLVLEAGREVRQDFSGTLINTHSLGHTTHSLVLLFYQAMCSSV